MSDLRIQPAAREPYEAPTIEDVPVRAEEQLLRGCKQPQGSGVGQPSPTGCQRSAQCITPPGS